MAIQQKLLSAKKAHSHPKKSKEAEDSNTVDAETDEENFVEVYKIIEII